MSSLNSALRGILSGGWQRFSPYAFVHCAPCGSTAAIKLQSVKWTRGKKKNTHTQIVQRFSSRSLERSHCPVHVNSPLGRSGFRDNFHVSLMTRPKGKRQARIYVLSLLPRYPAPYCEQPNDDADDADDHYSISKNRFVRDRSRKHFARTPGRFCGGTERGMKVLTYNFSSISSWGSIRRIPFFLVLGATSWRIFSTPARNGTNKSVPAACSNFQRENRTRPI